MNPILRKITTTPEKGIVTLSCGHDTSTKFIGVWLGGKPAHGWAPCSTCGLTRHMRTTGREGAAIARAAAAAEFLAARAAGKVAR